LEDQAKGVIYDCNIFMVKAKHFTIMNVCHKLECSSLKNFSKLV